MLQSGDKVKLKSNYTGYFKDRRDETFTVDRVIKEKHERDRITVLEIDELHLIGADWFTKEVVNVE